MSDIQLKEPDYIGKNHPYFKIWFTEEDDKYIYAIYTFVSSNGDYSCFKYIKSKRELFYKHVDFKEFFSVIGDRHEKELMSVFTNYILNKEIEKILLE